MPHSICSNKRHKRICIYINTVELRSLCQEDNSGKVMIDQEWPLDIGRLKAAIILDTGVESIAEVHVKLYGPAPPRKDTVWHPVAGHSVTCDPCDSDSEGAHKPWLCGEIIADAIGCAHDITHSKIEGAFVFIVNEPEIESAVTRVCRQGFEARLWSWEECLESGTAQQITCNHS